MKLQSESIDISQSVLIDKFTIYLKQKDRDTRAGEGYCFALGFLWAYKARIGEEKEFFDLVTKIADWNGIDNLDNEFEKLFSQIEWLQNTNKVLSHLSQTQVEQAVEIVDSPIQKEFSIAYLFKENEIIDLLEKVLNNKNKMITLCSHNHAINIIPEDGVYRLYDSNFRRGVFGFTNIKDLVTNKEKGILQAYVFENSRLSALKSLVLGKSWPKYIPLSVTVHDLANAQPGSYPVSFIDEIIQKDPKRRQDADMTSWNNVNAAWMAARANDVNTLKKLKELNADFNKGDKDGDTPLILAVYANSIEAVKWLLENGANIDATITSSGTKITIIDRALIRGSDPEIIESLLFAAIKKGDEQMAADLIDKGTINYLLEENLFNGRTVLHEATKNNQSDLIEAILAQIPQLLSKKDRDGKTALDIAREQKNDKVFQYLIKATLQEAIKNDDLDQVKKLVNEAPEIINEPAWTQLTPLLLAVQSKNYEVAKFLIQKGADIHLTVNNYSLLHFASERGDNDIIDLLVNSGLKIPSNLDGESPLMLAVQYGHIDTVKKLLQLGEATDVKDERDNTLLHIAAKNNHLAIMDLLLQNSNIVPIIETVDDQGQTPLHLAVASNRIEIIELLLTHGANTNLKTKEGNTLMHNAASLSNGTILKKFAAIGMDFHAMNNEGQKPIHFAIKWNNLENVKYILESQPSILKNDGFSILKLAVEEQNLPIIKYLIEEKNILNVIDNAKVMPLHWLGLNPYSSAETKKTVANYFLEKGFNINSKNETGSTPLHLAVQKNDLNYAKFLVDKNADINIEDNAKQNVKSLAKKDSPIEKFLSLGQFILDVKKGSLSILKNYQNKSVLVNERYINNDTPLHVAIQATSPLPVINFLVAQCNADINLKNDDGETPLHLAAKSSSNDILELLVSSKNANLYTCNKQGQTVMHKAIQSGKTDPVSLLVRKDKTLVYLSDSEGRTPLHYAALTNNIEVVKELLKAGANIHRQDDKGSTPLHLAIEKANIPMINFLITMGANLQIQDKMRHSPIDKALGNKEVSILLQNWIEKKKTTKPENDALLANLLSHFDIKKLKASERDLVSNLKKELQKISTDIDPIEYRNQLQSKVEDCKKKSKGKHKSISVFFSISTDLKKMFHKSKMEMEVDKKPEVETTIKM